MKQKINKYYKIYFDKDYETETQSSNRLLLRLFNKFGIRGFIEKGIPYLFAYEQGGTFYEAITNIPIFGIPKKIHLMDFYSEINCLGLNNYVIYNQLLEYMFGIDNHGIKDEDVTSMEEASQDRAIQFSAYEKGLTTINPYDKEHLNDFNIRSKLVKSKK